MLQHDSCQEERRSQITYVLKNWDLVLLELHKCAKIVLMYCNSIIRHNNGCTQVFQGNDKKGCNLPNRTNAEES